MDNQTNQPATPLEVIGTLTVASMALYAIRVIGVAALSSIRSKPKSVENGMEKVVEVVRNTAAKK